MHAFFHTKAAQTQHRSRPPRPPHAPRPPRPRACLLQLTVDSSAVTDLRALVMHTCGEALEFMRVAACDHGTRARVWLCVSRALALQLMNAVMRALPGAEFGRLTPLAGPTPLPTKATA